MQWAIDTLLNEHPEPAIVGDGCGEATFPSLQALHDASHAVEMVRELTAHEARDAANSWSSGGDGDITDGGSGTTVRRHHGSWPQSPPSSLIRRALPPSNNTNLPLVSWNFVTGSAQPGSGAMVEDAAAPPPRSLPEPAHGSPPPTRRRASLRSLGAASPASYARDHIIAERKRREKINKRLIELSTVIPDLKKVPQEHCSPCSPQPPNPCTDRLQRIVMQLLIN